MEGPSAALMNRYVAEAQITLFFVVSMFSPYFLQLREIAEMMQEIYIFALVPHEIW
jgi:hypothetical protein